MKSKESFFGTVCNLAIPVALQSMPRATFSIIDQIMIGQIGTVNAAGVGLAGKFSSIFLCWLQQNKKLKRRQYLWNEKLY